MHPSFVVGIIVKEKRGDLTAKTPSHAFNKSFSYNNLHYVAYFADIVILFCISAQKSIFLLCCGPTFSSLGYVCKCFLSSR